MKKLFLALLTVVSLSACASFQEEVIARSDGLSERPSWAKETVTYFEENGQAHFVGNMTASATRNPSWLCMASSNVAKKQAADYFKLNGSFRTQLAQKGLNKDISSFTYLGDETSSLENFTELKQEGCYWEKVISKTDHGDKLMYKTFVLLSVPRELIDDKLDR